MRINNSQRPKQRIPNSKKDKTWRDSSFRYYTDRSTVEALDRKNMLQLFRLANGHIEQDDYSYITNPLGNAVKGRPHLKSYPARLRNMDIISPIVMSLMGQMIEGNFDFTVVAKNYDIKSQAMKLQKEQWKQELLARFNNSLIDAGYDTGLPKQKENNPPDIDSLSSSLQAELSKQGQSGMDYIFYYNELPRKFRKAWYNFIVTGTVYSYRDVFRDETEYEIVNPLDFRWYASAETEFVEDGDSASLDLWMTVSEVIDKFREEEDFTDDIADALESAHSGIHQGHSGRTMNYFEEMDKRFYESIFGAGSYDIPMQQSGEVKVTHTVWRSQQKVLVVEFTDPLTGEKIKEEYSEEYVPEKGEDVTEEYRECIYEGYEIADKWIIGVKPIPYQRESMNGAKRPKLPYNGRLFNSNYVKARSIVEQGKVYQEKFNIIEYNIEKLIAKNKDKITVLPSSVVPNGEEDDMFSTMYYADAHGFIFPDSEDKEQIQALNHIKVLDMGLGDYIYKLYEIKRAIKEEFEEQVGFNRARKGQGNSSDSIGLTKQMTFQGNLVTAEYFEEFREFIERDLQALLDCSNIAFANGKKSSYITSDAKRAYIDLNPEVYPFMDKGVFVKNNREELMNLERFKEQAQAFAQNGSSPSTVAKILKANNMDKVVEEIENLEKEMMQNQQAQVQAEIASKEKEAEREDFHKNADRQVDVDNNIRDNNTKLTEAMMKLQEASQSIIESPEYSSEEKDRARENIQNITLKMKELALKERDSKRNLEAAKHRDATQLKVAKENKNKYDKK